MASKAGSLIDQLGTQDAVIDKVEAALRKEKQKREIIEKKLLKSFKTQALDGAAGRTFRASVKKSRYPSIANRLKFIRYVHENKAYDLFQNRITATAYFDREDEGDYVPGVKVFERVRVSVRKVRK